MKQFSDLRRDQVEAIEFICSGEDSLLYADVGAGKTVIALTAVQRFPQYRWLGVAPRKVCLNTWQQECEQWSHLRGMQIALALGEPEQRRAMIEGYAQLVLINYENLQWLCETYDPLPFDALICDEIDKLKDPKSKRFKQFRKRVKHLKKRVGMTGTPTGNHLLDLWAQAFLIDHGESLGKSFYKFRSEFFYQADFAGYDWRPFPGAEEKIYAKLDGLVHVIRNPIGMPAVVDLPPRYLELPPHLMKRYRKFERTLADKESGVIADTAGVASGKLQQFASGFLYVDEELREPERWYEKIHTAKFDDLDDLISELQGQQLMIVYAFRAELYELQTRYHDTLRHLGGGTTDAEDEKTIELWNKGELQLLAIHAASAGHGLNLQYAKPKHIYFLTRPWSAGAVTQVVGRIKRPGGANTVYMHTPVVRGTRDEDVLVANAYKENWNQGAKDAFARRTA